MSDYYDEEEEEIYEVSDIIRSKIMDGVEKFLVRWKGYGPEDDTWEPIENLDGCPDILQRFKERQKREKEREHLSKPIRSEPALIPIYQPPPPPKRETIKEPKIDYMELERREEEEKNRKLEEYKKRMKEEEEKRRREIAEKIKDGSDTLTGLHGSDDVRFVFSHGKAEQSFKRFNEKQHPIYDVLGIPPEYHKEAKKIAYIENGEPIRILGIKKGDPKPKVKVEFNVNQGNKSIITQAWVSVPIIEAIAPQLLISFLLESYMADREN